MTRDIDSPNYRDSNVGEGVIPPRKSATPKHRAGEHVPGRRFSSRYPEGIGGDYYMQPDPIKELEAERDLLMERERELVKALEDIRDELQQANGGKGPSLPLSAHVLGIARAALAKHGR